MLYREQVLFILIIFYTVVGLGTVLRVKENTNILEKLLFFFLMPFLAVAGWGVWAMMQLSYGRGKTVKNIFRYFSILPLVCEGIAFCILDLLKNVGRQKPKRPAEGNAGRGRKETARLKYAGMYADDFESAWEEEDIQAFDYREEDTRIRVLSRKRMAGSVPDLDSGIYSPEQEEVDQAATRIRRRA